MTAVVELVNVTKRFGGFVAVDNVSFSIAKGEIVSLLGPSGCGKTTTLRMISGFEDPEEGEVRIMGGDMKGKRPYERNVNQAVLHGDAGAAHPRGKSEGPGGRDRGELGREGAGEAADVAREVDQGL